MTRAYNPAEIEQALRAIHAQDPLFSPHSSTAFEVLERLGEGGMGTVFEVRDRRTGRRAALKVLNNPQADDKARERFLREALLTSCLDHPAIPPVYEVGKTPRGDLYLLMRLIQGQTFAERLQLLKLKSPEAQKTEISELLSALLKASEAIAYAHSQGIIHRDLKPDNIMIGRFGEVYLMDWGIAKKLDDAQADLTIEGAVSRHNLAPGGLTLAGAAIGTVGYMAPEQARGEDLDQRADVYALGLLLGEVLAQQPLIDAEGRAAKHIANLEGLAKVELVQAAPAPLRWLVNRCLQIDPKLRLSSADEFGDALEAILAGRAPKGFQEPISQVIWRWRSPILALSLSTVTLLGSLAFGQKQREEMASNNSRQLSALRAELNLLRSNHETTERDLGNSAAQSKNLKSELESTRTQLETTRNALDQANNRAMAAETRAHAAEQRLKLAEEEAARKGEVAASTTEILRRAQSKRQSGDWRGYFADIDAILISDPQHLEALLDRASSYYSSGDYEKARRDVKVALAKHPKSARAHCILGNIESNLGKLAAARTAFDEAINLDPNYAWAYNARGLLREGQNDLLGALADYDKAIEVDASCSAAYGNRGYLKVATGDSPGGRIDYDKALELNPNDANTYNNRGLLNAAEGRQRDALNDYAKSLELRPRQTTALLNRSSLRFTMGDKKGAMDDLDQALQNAPRSTKILQRRALVRLELNETEAAIADLEKALEINPKLPNADELRAQIAKLRSAPR